jgi:uncharacterized protein YebE (UPF0316 family)
MSLNDLVPEAYVSLLIFLSRIMDVSMGTMRIIFVNRGMKNIAASLGFFEVLIWITVVASVIANMSHWSNYVAYAGGFAAGNYLGIVIEQKLKVGTQVFRIISKIASDDLLKKLSSAGFRATMLNAKGIDGQEQIIFTVAKRKSAPQVISIIQQTDPNAFYSIEDVKFASDTSNTSIEKGSRTPFMQLLSTRKSI